MSHSMSQCCEHVQKMSCAVHEMSLGPRYGPVLSTAAKALVETRFDVQNDPTGSNCFQLLKANETQSRTFTDIAPVSRFSRHRHGQDRWFCSRSPGILQPTLQRYWFLGFHAYEKLTTYNMYNFDNFVLMCHVSHVSVRDRMKLVSPGGFLGICISWIIELLAIWFRHWRNPRIGRSASSSGRRWSAAEWLPMASYGFRWLPQMQILMFYNGLKPFTMRKQVDNI